MWKIERAIDYNRDKRRESAWASNRHTLWLNMERVAMNGAGWHWNGKRCSLESISPGKNVCPSGEHQLDKNGRFDMKIAKMPNKVDDNRRQKLIMQDGRNGRWWKFWSTHTDTCCESFCRLDDVTGPDGFVGVCAKCLDDDQNDSF